MSFNIRLARARDVPEILRIQALCYNSIEPEKAQAYHNKLEQAPDCAFVIVDRQQLLAYLFSVPVMLDNPPGLDSHHYCVPQHADCLYLHDLAIDPAARGSGLSKPLLQRYFSKAEALQVQHLSLIAIQQSEAFWQRYGFHTRHAISQDQQLQQKLRSYGQATYMTQTLSHAGNSI